jgi:mercuric ion transport protein
MSDRALIRAGTVGAIFAAICCAAPLLAVTLPLAGLGAWSTGSGLVVLSLIAAGLGLVAWGIHHRRAKVACSNTKILNEGLKP